MAKPEKKKKKGLKVDFSGTEVRLLIPEDTYPAKVLKITQEEGNEHDYLKWVFEIKSDQKGVGGQKVYTNTSLAPQALWNLRNLLETLGVETPDSEFDLNLDEYVGMELMLRVEHEDFEGKMRARVSDYMPLEETAESEDDGDEEEETEEEETEEEAPPPKKPAAGKKPDKKPAKKPEPEEEEEVEEEEEEAEEEAEEEVVEEEEETDDEPEEEESEEDDGKVTSDEVREMDKAELGDLNKKHSLGLKLKDLPMSKRISMVIDALEKADLLAD